jgi:predicted GNAT family N-acyltransferase
MQARDAAQPRAVIVSKVDLDRIAQCQAVRHSVFVEEQGVPVELELDGRDPECAHFLAIDASGAPLGTARSRALGSIAKIERVAVLARARGAGVGRALMAAVERDAAERGFTCLKLSAQVTVLEFYAALGYREISATYLDAGIEHRDMLKSIDSGA